MKRIQIDAGMYGTKATCGEEKFYCRTLVAPIDQCATDNGYKVEYCGHTYMVSEESIPTNYDYDKKRLENKIVTYLAIAQFIEKENEKVNVIIGMPLEHWLDRQRRLEFENYFKSNCIKLKITKNGATKEVSFAINNIKAFPETMGHLYLPTNQEKYKDVTVAILDCGGCNFQGAIYRNMVPIKETCFTSNKGINFYLDEVKRAINNKFGTNYQNYQIDDLIKYGAINDDKGLIAEEIKKVTRAFFMGVLREARSRNWMIEGLPIVVTGGGSCYFVEVINELLHKATISENGVWDNVNGFSEIGGIIYAGEETAI